MSEFWNRLCRSLTTETALPGEGWLGDLTEIREQGRWAGGMARLAETGHMFLCLLSYTSNSSLTI